jgi:hypothetical protein
LQLVKVAFSPLQFIVGWAFIATDPYLFSVYISEAELVDIVKMSFGNSMQECTNYNFAAH